MRRDGTVWTTDKDGIILGLLAAEMTARHRSRSGRGLCRPDAPVRRARLRADRRAGERRAEERAEATLARSR